MKRKIKILSLRDIFHYVEVKKKKKEKCLSHKSLFYKLNHGIAFFEKERKYLTNKHEDDARFNPVINME